MSRKRKLIVSRVPRVPFICRSTMRLGCTCIQNSCMMMPLPPKSYVRRLMHHKACVLCNIFRERLRVPLLKWPWTLSNQFNPSAKRINDFGRPKCAVVSEINSKIGKSTECTHWTLNFRMFTHVTLVFTCFIFSRVLSCSIQRATFYCKSFSSWKTLRGFLSYWVDCVCWRRESGESQTTFKRTDEMEWDRRGKYLLFVQISSQVKVATGGNQ